MRNGRIALLNVIFLVCTVYAIINSINVLFIISILIVAVTLIYILLSKMSYFQCQYKNSEQSYVYVCRKGKLFHIDKNCKEIGEQKVLILPRSYADRNNLKLCKTCEIKAFVK